MDISKIVDSSDLRAVTSVARMARDAEQAVRRASFQDLTELSSLTAMASAASLDTRDYARDLARLAGAFSAAEVAATARGDQWANSVEQALGGAWAAQQVARQADDLLRSSAHVQLREVQFASWQDAYDRIAGLTDTLTSLQRQLDEVTQPAWVESTLAQVREAWDTHQRLFDLVFPESLHQVLSSSGWREDLLHRWAELADDDAEDGDVDSEADAPALALDPESVLEAATESAPRRDAAYATGIALAGAQLAAVAQRFDPLSAQGENAAGEWTVTIAAHVPHHAVNLCTIVHEIQQRATLYFAAPGHTSAGKETWMAEDDVAFEEAVQALDRLLRQITAELDSDRA